MTRGALIHNSEIYNIQIDKPRQADFKCLKWGD